MDGDMEVGMDSMDGDMEVGMDSMDEYGDEMTVKDMRDELACIYGRTVSVLPPMVLLHDSIWILMDGNFCRMSDCFTESLSDAFHECTGDAVLDKGYDRNIKNPTGTVELYPAAELEKPAMEEPAMEEPAMEEPVMEEPVQKSLGSRVLDVTRRLLGG